MTQEYNFKRDGQEAYMTAEEAKELDVPEGTVMTEISATLFARLMGGIEGFVKADKLEAGDKVIFKVDEGLRQGDVDRIIERVNAMLTDDVKGLALVVRSVRRALLARL